MQDREYLLKVINSVANKKMPRISQNTFYKMLNLRRKEFIIQTAKLQTKQPGMVMDMTMPPMQHGITMKI